MKFTTLLLLGLVSAQDLLDNTTAAEETAAIAQDTADTKQALSTFFRDIPYADSLPCASCILGGFNYCYKGRNGVPFKGPAQGDKPMCFKDAASASNQYKSKGFSCTADFGTDIPNRIYALSACPQSQDICGSLAGQENTFTNVGVASNSSGVSNMTAGTTCSYRFSADCGSPYFSIADFKNTTFPGVTVIASYIEFDANSTN